MQKQKTNDKKVISFHLGSVFFCPCMTINQSKIAIFTHTQTCQTSVKIRRSPYFWSILRSLRMSFQISVTEIGLVQRAAVPLVVEFFKNIDFQGRYDGFSETPVWFLSVIVLGGESESRNMFIWVISKTPRLLCTCDFLLKLWKELWVKIWKNMWGE